jgi:hypothetical protein
VRLAAVPASTETTMIDKLPTINFVKHYLDEVSLVLDGLDRRLRRILADAPPVPRPGIRGSSAA